MRVVLTLLLMATLSAAGASVDHAWNQVSHPALVTDPPGVREAALGGAASLLVQGPAAAWWNPARLAGASSGVVGSVYSMWPEIPVSEDIQHQFLAGSWATGWKGLGVGLAANRHLYSEQVYTDENGHERGTHRTQLTDLTLAAGLPLGPAWQVGGGVRWVQLDWSPMTTKGTAWALNAGAVWSRPGSWPLKAGIKLDNVGTLVQYGEGGNEPLPASANLSLALDGRELAGGRLRLAGEAVKPLSYRYAESVSRELDEEGNPLFWDGETGTLTDNPWFVELDGDSLANVAAYHVRYESSSMPVALVKSWFRQGLSAELSQCIYRLGMEYEREFDLPHIGRLGLALRGGRWVLPANATRVWSYGLGLAWRDVTLDASFETQPRVDDPSAGWNVRHGTRRLALGWTF